MVMIVVVTLIRRMVPGPVFGDPALCLSSKKILPVVMRAAYKIGGQRPGQVWLPYLQDDYSLNRNWTPANAFL